MRTENTAITYKELDSLISGFTSALYASGIAANSRIAILAQNSTQYVALVWALLRVGACVVPLNLRWSQDSLQAAIEQAQCDLIFFDREIDFSTFSIQTKKLELNSFNPEKAVAGLCSQQLSLKDGSFVMFTSGSSGEPKGVILTAGNFYFNALGANQNIPLQEGDCWLASLPFYHVGGLSILFRCFLAGAAAHLPSKLDQTELKNLIARKVSTHISVVPTMLQQLLATCSAQTIRDNLKCILLGGAPAKTSLIEEIIRQQLPVFTTYGLTESASQVTTVAPDDPKEKLKTSGKCLPYREICILNQNSEELAAETVGEIAVKGEILFKGYLSDEFARHSDDWFRTGDVGYFDRDGFLIVKGRKDDLIISGGENIYPAEIERVVFEFPHIRDCCAVGIPSEKWGQRPGLFLEIENVDSFDFDEFKKFLKQKLSKLTFPDRVIVMQKLPRTGIGKIDKSRLVNSE